MAKRPDLRAVSAASEEQTLAEERGKSCPVRRLGYEGLIHYYQTASGDVIPLHARAHVMLNIVALFDGWDKWLWDEFPMHAKGDEGRKIGWQADPAAKWLIRECRAAGYFDIQRDLRGPGVWRIDYPAGEEKRPDDPTLIVHVGDQMWLVGGAGPTRRIRWQRLDRIGEHVYCAARKEMRPADKPIALDEIAKLVRFLGRWKYRRPDIDPVLLLGWIGAAMMVGALDWRPALWIAGQADTGKTTLQRLVRRLLASLLTKLSDTTAAGLRGLLRGAARPVALDELEAKEDNSKVLDVIELARLCSTRGEGLIARADMRSGTTNLYAIEALLLYSSILPPPLTPQDQQRITNIDLLRYDQTHDDIRREVDAFGKLGPGMRRRMIDGWDRFEAMLERFGRKLKAEGHTSRGADQHGTLLACAWVLMNDGLSQNDGELEVWTKHLSVAELAFIGDTRPDHIRCLVRLLTSPEGNWRDGRRRTIAELIRLAAGMAVPGSTKITKKEDTRDAARDLADMGLRVYPREKDEPKSGWLAVSNSHEGTAKLFEGTHWAKGGWVRTLLDLPGAERASSGVRFGASPPTRAVMIPLDALHLDGGRSDDQGS